VSKVDAGWDAALEWAAAMIDTGYPNAGERVDPHAIAMTLRAKKGDVDLERVGLEIAMQVYRQKQANV
jgi:hypothetical protein